jgi:hypothetical protein
MIMTILLLALLAMLTATGATSLALMTIQPSAAARPLATTHLLKLQDELALP